MKTQVKHEDPKPYYLRLLGLMAERSLTAYQLSALTNIDQANFTHWSRGRQIGRHHRKTLCGFFNITEEWFMTGEGEKRPPKSLIQIRIEELAKENEECMKLITDLRGEHKKAITELNKTLNRERAGFDKREAQLEEEINQLQEPKKEG